MAFRFYSNHAWEWLSVTWSKKIISGSGTFCVKLLSKIICTYLMPGFHSSRNQKTWPPNPRLKGYLFPNVKNWENRKELCCNSSVIMDLRRLQFKNFSPMKFFERSFCLLSDLRMKKSTRSLKIKQSRWRKPSKKKNSPRNRKSWYSSSHIASADSKSLPNKFPLSKT